MIIKKFIGKTEAEALTLAKTELGESIVVMNVRMIKHKGIFSIFKPQKTEVTVALEEESEKIAAGQQVKKEPVLKPELIAASEISTTKSTVNDEENNKNSFMEPITEKNADNTVIEEKLENLQSLLEKQLQKPEEDKESKESVKTEEPSEMLTFLKLLYNTMIDNEVNEKYANQIIDEMDKTNKPNVHFDYALANIYQKMILKFGKPSTITPAESGPKIVFFVGPTGVGKTTTIAKIASKFSVEQKKKVALLTADTYRIAAAEQLRTYANILEVPFRVIYTVEEVEMALRDFNSFDYILVDTAGHSHQNMTQKENMNAFIHSVDGIAEKEVFLVLSATTKYRDLVSIAESYGEMTDYKLIFTKLDETTTLGNLLNLKLHTGASLSYVTCGQNVPDDIEQFNPQKTVKMLLGGKN